MEHLKLGKLKPISQFERYLIGDDGEITYAASKKRVKTYLDKYGEIVVDLKNEKRSPLQFRVAKLVLLHFGDMNIEANYSFASVFYRDGNKLNIHVDNLAWIFDDKGYYPLFIPGVNCQLDTFVRIPGYSRYQINSLGVIERMVDRTIVPHTLGNRGYFTVTLIDDTGYRAPVKVHRLLALIFLPHPHDTEDLVVNHKDHNKINNSLSNLEWVTPSYNRLHAQMHGHKNTMQNRQKPLAMKVDTREIMEFKTLVECATFFGVNTTTIEDPLTNRRGIRPYNGYYLKYDDDPRPWPEEDTTFNIRGSKAVLLKHIDTGTITRFVSMQEAGKFLDVSTSSIYNQLTYEHARPYKGYLIRNDNPDVDWTVYEKEHRPSHRGSDIVITDIYTGVSQVYDSIRAVSEAMGVPKESLYSSIHRGSPCGRMMVSYVTSPD